MKKILVVNSHPREESFVNAITHSYIDGARSSNNEIELIHLSELGLEDYVNYNHAKAPELSKKLRKVQDLITWANHLVFVYPTWWYAPPAILKLFIEIVFHSGFAFKYTQPSKYGPRWDKYLNNKSARIISTMDAPPLYYRLLVGDPGYKMVKASMEFCGIKPVGKNYFGSVKVSTEEQKIGWLDNIYNVGKNEN